MRETTNQTSPAARVLGLTRNGPHKRTGAPHGTGIMAEWKMGKEEGGTNPVSPPRPESSNEFPLSLQ